jgi:hypothetical protein
MMSVLQSHQPDTEPKAKPKPKPKGRLYAVTPETEVLARRRAGAAEALAHRGSPPETVSECGSDVARTSATQANPSRSTTMLPIFAAAFAVRFGGAAAASECPKHIADTQELIDRISADMEADEDRMPGDMAGLAYALLDDARMLLGAARRNHEEPHRPYDHARAFAKADAALGHARAAQILHSRCAQQQL